MDSDKSVEAHFIRVYNLSKSLDPSKGGTISISPSGGTYEEGTEVTVTAEPASGYEFDHWSGDLSGASGTKTVTLNSDMSVTAYFTKTGEEEGGGLSLTWIAIGIGVIIAVIATVVVVKKYSGEKARGQ
ncbi:hypothetical protein AKJ65_04515 [candidate division MSBL1 archaeon SCGC-AAA259E19]|uniref:Bacterial repeat domain-containing protein n=1 Tax=candidate division MSBL1 archaeon SCGC-AAA259E19 TaxID=1698264 RepID=A0A133UJK9_9EURY|nr:hypothetical protein AKJ65_04515 [candidate division MSBL1 archaeon SCGC-AAA259E19]